MIRTKLIAFFDVVWLPALLLISTSWLYGPWLHHVHAGQLSYISTYEGAGMPFAGIFRFCDILSGIVIMIVVWRVRLLSRHRWLGWAVLSVAGFMILDDIFILGCYQACDSWAVLRHGMHLVESAASLCAVALATAVDARRSGNIWSRLFLVLQILGAISISTGLASSPQRIFMQYIYQVVVMVWLVYVLQRYAVNHRPSIPASTVRTTFAIIVFTGGLIELVLAFHLGVYGEISKHLLLRSEPVWLAEHSVAAGVVLLYMARYIQRGQRRAAIIIAIILATEIVKYSLVTPHAALLLFGELSMLALWIGWPAFNRNTGIPPISSRLKNLAILLSGVLLAIGLLLSVAAATGHGRELLQDTQQAFATSAERLKPASQRGSHLQYRLTHLRYISAGLGLSLLVVTISILFRPAGSASSAHQLSKQKIERLLQQYATSSEDFFKLWPTDKSYFTTAGIEGFIAYKRVSGTVFALADPVCDPQDRERFLSDFSDFCRRHGWSVCFILITAESIAMYESNNLKSLMIGSSAIIPIRKFVESTTRNKWWRWQLNRAQRAGLMYEVSQPPHSRELLRETSILSRSWLERAGHTEQGFALGYYDETYMQTSTLHLLRDANGGLVAFANQLPVYHGLRQATVDLIRFQPDVDGAMPVLIANLLIHLQSTGEYDNFDLGFVPLAKMETKSVAIARRLAAGRFSAAGLEQFKGKFEPQWQPQYLAYDGDLVDLAALFTRLQKALRVEP
jgi:lysylphosphatidylglycerol synthetase-like protein (DUF2156 family)